MAETLVHLKGWIRMDRRDQRFGSESKSREGLRCLSRKRQPLLRRFRDRTEALASSAARAGEIIEGGVSYEASSIQGA